MQRNKTRQIALGGLLAALAVVIMCLGGLIPVATYVCPMLCCMTQFVVLRYCGKRVAWAWFAVVTILSLLSGPDKEAAMVFLALGAYPILKEYMEKCRIAIFLKLLFFNSAIMLSYFCMIYLLGMQYVVEENSRLGFVGIAIILLLGNITFLLLDKLLDIMSRKLR